jgi:chorismate mutase/prephenate dehydratase
VLGRQLVKPTGDDKTSLMVSIKDKPGALYNLLVPFSEANISLTRIESRPSQKKGLGICFLHRPAGPRGGRGGV